MPNVINFINKSENGFDYAFIGLASIWDYEIFWKQLELSNLDTELVSAWYNPSIYPTLKAKELKWFDTGNLDDIEKDFLPRFREFYGSEELRTCKNCGEIMEVDKRFV